VLLASIARAGMGAGGPWRSVNAVLPAAAPTAFGAMFRAAASGMA